MAATLRRWIQALVVVLAVACSSQPVSPTSPPQAIDLGTPNPTRGLPTNPPTPSPSPEPLNVGDTAVRRSGWKITVLSVQRKGLQVDVVLRFENGTGSIARSPGASGFSDDSFTLQDSHGVRVRASSYIGFIGTQLVTPPADVLRSVELAAGGDVSGRIQFGVSDGETQFLLFVDWAKKCDIPPINLSPGGTQPPLVCESPTVWRLVT